MNFDAVKLTDVVDSQTGTPRTDLTPRFQNVLGKTLPLKKQRIFIVGMETRNHAVFKTEYGAKLDLHFYTGGKKNANIRPRQEDLVLVAADFCSHTMYNTFMNNMKRHGFKEHIILIKL